MQAAPARAPAKPSPPRPSSVSPYPSPFSSRAPKGDEPLERALGALRLAHSQGTAQAFG